LCVYIYVCVSAAHCIAHQQSLSFGKASFSKVRGSNLFCHFSPSISINICGGISLPDAKNFSFLFSSLFSFIYFFWDKCRCVCKVQVLLSAPVKENGAWPDRPPALRPAVHGPKSGNAAQPLACTSVGQGPSAGLGQLQNGNQTPTPLIPDPLHKPTQICW
jgi:hypothetical protein